MYFVTHEVGNQSQSESTKLFDSRHSINALLDAVFSKYLVSNHRLMKHFPDLASF